MAGRLPAALDSLHAFWALGTDANDRAGTSLHLTARGKKSFTNGALLLTGAGRAELAAAPLTTAWSSSHALSAWFSANGGGTVLSASSAGGTAPTISVGIDAAGLLTAVFHGRDIGDTTQAVTIQHAGVVAGWHHVVVGWSPEQAPMLYLDGVQIGGEQADERTVLV